MPPTQKAVKAAKLPPPPPHQKPKVALNADLAREIALGNELALSLHAIAQLPDNARTNVLRVATRICCTREFRDSVKKNLEEAVLLMQV